MNLPYMVASISKFIYLQKACKIPLWKFLIIWILNLNLFDRYFVIWEVYVNQELEYIRKIRVEEKFRVGCVTNRKYTLFFFAPYQGNTPIFFFLHLTKVSSTNGKL